MASYLDVVSGEIASIKHMLASLPFDRTEGLSHTKSPYFLDVYRVHRPEMLALNEDNGVFPLDASKLLKLGISLGNLLKSLQQDEEQYLEQQKKQQQFNKSLGGALIQPGSHSGLFQPAKSALYSDQLGSPYAPSNDRRISASSGTNGGASFQIPPPPYQTRFVQNLLKILKNYDIGTATTYSNTPNFNSNSNNTNNNNILQQTPSNLNLQSLQSLQPVALSGSSTSTLSQQMQGSPIKLSSKQLLIEKLEINIQLDNLFTYKILLKLVQQIYEIIELQLEVSGGGGVLNGTVQKDVSSSSSIFSTASYSSSDSSMTNDEYLQLLRLIVNRISTGIIEPFIQVIVTQIAERGVIERFGELLKSLD